MSLQLGADRKPSEPKAADIVSTEFATRDLGNSLEIYLRGTKRIEAMNGGAVAIVDG